MMHGRCGVGRGFGGGLRRRLRLMEEAHGRLHQGVWLRLSGTRWRVAAPCGGAEGALFTRVS